MQIIFPFVLLASTSKNIKYYNTQNKFIVVLSDWDKLFIPMEDTRDTDSIYLKQSTKNKISA
jgi:hypothetical protein